MKAILMAVVGLGLASLQAAAQEVEERKEKNAAPAAVAPLSLRLSDEVIAKAVRETLAEHPGSQKLASDKTPNGALSGDPYQKFARGFSEAEKPGCLRPDAMKFQPHGTMFKLGGQDYVMEATGNIAIPFWIAAIVRGKCN